MTKIKSEFKRLTKLEKGLPKSGRTFLAEAGVKNYGGVIAGWAKGNLGTTKDYVLVLNDGETGEFLVVSRVEGEIKVEAHTSMYQAFLAHKAARFA